MYIGQFWRHKKKTTMHRPTDSADVNKRLQPSDTNSILSVHGGFLLVSGLSIGQLCVTWFKGATPPAEDKHLDCFVSQN